MDESIDIFNDPLFSARLSVSIATGRLKAALKNAADKRQAGQIQGALDDLGKITENIEKARTAAEKHPSHI